MACLPFFSDGACAFQGFYPGGTLHAFNGFVTSLYHNNGYDGGIGCTGSSAIRPASCGIYIGNTGAWNSGTKTGFIAVVGIGDGSQRAVTIDTSIITALGIGTFAVSIKAADGIFIAAPNGGGTLTILCPNALNITLPLTTPDGAVGTVYPTQTFTTINGTAPYTYSISAGALPAGLVLSSGGVLSGTPTTAGLYNFTVTVTDTISCTTSRAYSIFIPGQHASVVNFPIAPSGGEACSTDLAVEPDGGEACSAYLTPSTDSGA